MDTTKHHPEEVVVDVTETWLSSSHYDHLCPKCDLAFCFFFFFAE